MTPADLHELRPAESVAARELILRILNHEYAMALTLDELPDLVDIHATYRHSEGNFWVASIGGDVVGCIGVLRLAGADFELRRMYVDAAARGQGIAQRLLETALAWCAERGVGDLYLETNEQWKAAHHIYEKRGFVAVEREQLPPAFPVVRVATGFYRLGIAPAAPANERPCPRSS
jgi:GNAT superfamily N-acetyltransferase